LPLFVFCKLRGVLLPEFGDLILRLWDQKMAQLQADSVREKCRSRDSSRLSEVAKRISSADDLRESEKIEAAGSERGGQSHRRTQGGRPERQCALTALRQICQN
jgi:hypothetical protein